MTWAGFDDGSARWGRVIGGARVPPALRAAIAAYARDERAAGASCRAIAHRLGVSSESIRRWARPGSPHDGAAALVPVHVVAEAGRPLTVWAPTGYRVEGLSVAETAELLRRLA
jgi:hypothetical protein